MSQLNTYGLQVQKIGYFGLNLVGHKGIAKHICICKRGPMVPIVPPAREVRLYSFVSDHGLSPLPTSHEAISPENVKGISGTYYSGGTLKC